MIRVVFAALSLLLAWPIGISRSVLAGQSALVFDDRAVLELVIDEIWAQAGTGALRPSRLKTEQIWVVQGARPVCREKVYERDPPWPLMCAPEGREMELNLAGRARLPAIELAELMRSFKERNSKWNDLPTLASAKVIWLPRQEYIDGARRIDLAVVSLPGYSPDGHAVVHATFGCGNLCGTTWYATLERTDGSWTIIDFFGRGVA